MALFLWILALLLGSVLLGLAARRLGAPYPALLALAGAGLAFSPFAPALTVPPDLALALFVAPVLMDAAYDASLRDIRRSWFAIAGLVIAAVGVTTAAVAVVARALVPTMPWGAAVALGAVVAPPDAVAALAVLRQVRPAHRVMTILEGESLLNDATALLIYRMAVGAVVAGGFGAAQVAPALVWVGAGSVALGAGLAWAYTRAMDRVDDVPSAIILQFVGTFGVWLLADALKLSGVLTIVAYAVVVARRTAQTPARIRVPSFAVWETSVYVLNVIAFVLMGLQIRPILAGLEPSRRHEYLLFAAAVLATAVVARLVWVLGVNTGLRLKNRYFGVDLPPGVAPPTLQSGLTIAWCGMRGVVTLAAAFALPIGFPYRDLILLAAFAVVLGTLTLQGLTLRPLVRLLRLSDDRPVEREVRAAREAVARAALEALDGARGAAADALRREYEAALDGARCAPEDSPGRDTEHDVLRRRSVLAQRLTLTSLRTEAVIGDDAFHRVEAELDWAELYAWSRAEPTEQPRNES
jgi:CPA1 family monovalent cation:H+ antiporter